MKLHTGLAAIALLAATSSQAEVAPKSAIDKFLALGREMSTDALKGELAAK